MLMVGIMLIRNQRPKRTRISLLDGQENSNIIDAEVFPFSILK